MLLYLDYDAPVAANRSLHPLLCLAQNEPRGVALIHDPCLTDRAWTKLEAARALRASQVQLDSEPVGRRLGAAAR